MDAFKQKMTKKCEIGGIKCSCCNPFHPSDRDKTKKKLNRLARRTLKASDQKDLYKSVDS